MPHGNTELQRLLSEWSNWLSAYQENTYFKLYPHLHQQLVPLSIFPINSSTILSRTYKVIHIQLLATACVYTPVRRDFDKLFPSASSSPATALTVVARDAYLYSCTPICSRASRSGYLRLLSHACTYIALQGR